MTDQPETDQLARCPRCGEPTVPGAAFCGNCGASLTVNEATADTGYEDAQTTATYVPVSSLPDATEGPPAQPARPTSPWAPPDSDEYAAPGTESPTGGRVSTPYGDTTTHADTEHAAPAPSESVRGLFLGILAFILIGMVFALYVYDAWLSDSARTTVEGWLPWLE